MGILRRTQLKSRKARFVIGAVCALRIAEASIFILTLGHLELALSLRRIISSDWYCNWKDSEEEASH